MNNYEYINDELRKNNIIPVSDIIQILKGKVSDPHVGSKKTLKILDIFKRQIEFINSLFILLYISLKPVKDY